MQWSGDRRTSITVKAEDQHAAMRETLWLIRERGEIFKSPKGEVLLRVEDGKLVPVKARWLKDYLNRIAEWTEEIFDRSKPPKCRRYSYDCPGWLPSRILAVENWNLPPLQGVITAPTMRLDGTILDKPGYDAETGLLLQGSQFPRVGGIGVKEALAILWEPVKLFPLADDVSKAVMLTALLTGVVRKVLPAAPGFVIDAPKTDTGNTLACSCAQIIATGMAQVLTAKNGAKFTQQLRAGLRAGSSSIFFDNVKEDSELEFIFTAPDYKYLVPGKTELVTVSTRSLFLFTANNYIPRGGFRRRLLICRLDAQAGKPVDQREYCLKHRQQLVAAALTLLKAYVDAGKPKQSKKVMGSFEDFDALVRQCVLWLGYPDPAESQYMSSMNLKTLGQ